MLLPERGWNGAAIERLDEVALSLADYAIPVEILDGVGREQELRELLDERAATPP